MRQRHKGEEPKILPNFLKTMKFRVTRTSLGHDEQPCKESFKEKTIRVDERTVNDPAKIKTYSGGDAWWYAEGVNHRIEQGHIKRDFEEDGWFVEISDLDSLIKFCDKYGDLVLSRYFLNPAERSIEIYDGYRE